jgi:divalent metal cation (Fe/Co/Zn/Cd) transporter
MPADRRHLVRSALRLSYLTIAWNLAAGGSALLLALVAGSLSLGGFALSTLIDMGASVALVWRFTMEARDTSAAERLERRAEALIGAAMFAAALFLAVESVRALVAHAHPETSVGGLVVSSVSLMFLPPLARAKWRVASSLHSRALRGDSILTGASSVLALLTLVALVLNRTLGWWWTDAVAALAIAAGLATEATRAEMEARRRD